MVDPFAFAYRPPVERPARFPCDLESETARLEVDLLERALAQARYSQAEAASLLGLSYHQMRALLRKHGVVRPRGSQGGPSAA